MNKIYLQSKLKSKGTAYLLLIFLFGSHYAYLDKWGKQILFWMTAGGLGIWWVIDLLTLSGRIDKHNNILLSQIDDLDKKEKDADHAKNMAMISASRG